MKVFIAQLATETNTFAAAPTGLGAFEEYGIYRGDASRRAPDGAGQLLAALRRLIEDSGHEVAEGLCAFAQPAGPTVRSVYERLRDDLLEGLAAAMPVDAVMLLLHGAMVAEGYDDCEGDLLERVRRIVGPDVPVGAELDLHCHFTELKRRQADVIVAFKEYPHTDALDRARELWRILRDTAEGRVRPTTAVYDCRMVGIWHTTREPMRSFVARMQECEASEGVLSVSLGHGFPWGDVPEAGAKLWVVTDNAPEKAAALAERLGREFWALRHATSGEELDVDSALDAALACEGGPVVLADVADNPGGGAPGDSTFILRRMIERGIGQSVIGAFWDPGAIHICRDAGVGARVDLRVGGKCGPSSGDPVDVRVTVRAIVENLWQSDMTGGKYPFGTGAWVETDGGLHLLLATVRGQVFDPDAFTGVGMTLADKKIIVVKSTQHFHAGFAPIARQVLYVSTPGAITPDFRNIDYKRRSLNYWPRVDDPHAQPAGG